MKPKDRKAWQEKNVRLYSNYKIKLGDRVVDDEGHKGVVVKIVEGVDDCNHGFVYVWQEDRIGYGEDNCEHYCHINWFHMLRVI